jgi:hypothetical protein
MAGNDLFVGSYVSQSEAQQAVQLALAQARRRDSQDDRNLILSHSQFILCASLKT